MQTRTLLGGLALLLTTLNIPAASDAHSKVTASTPAEGSTVAKPKVITISFSEALLPPTASASIVMTAMPGMKDHGEMVIRNFATAWSNGNRTMKLTLKKALAAGSYDVRWKAAGADGHRMSGTIKFKVK
jgi:copper resistance protein C